MKKLKSIFFILLLTTGTAGAVINYNDVQQQQVVKSTPTIRNDFYWRGSLHVIKSSYTIFCASGTEYIVLRDTGLIEALALQLGYNKKISTDTVTGYGGLYVSTHMVVVGISSATMYYGDGSGLYNVSGGGVSYATMTAVLGTIPVDIAGGTQTAYSFVFPAVSTITAVSVDMIYSSTDTSGYWMFNLAKSTCGFSEGTIYRVITSTPQLHFPTGLTKYYKANLVVGTDTVLFNAGDWVAIVLENGLTTGSYPPIARIKIHYVRKLDD